MKKFIFTSILFLTASVALAGFSSFSLSGKIQGSTEHYTGFTKLTQTGCFVYVNNIEILIPGADQIPCNRIYRVGRKININGVISSQLCQLDSCLLQTTLVATYFIWETN